MRALRTTTRVTATLTAAGVMALAAGPAFAADTTVVAQSEAEAIYLQLGPQVLSDQLSGPYRAERTGQGETTEGNNQPQADLLEGQDSLGAGTLAQDAQTGLAGNRGVSEACSGVAGAGSSFVGVGDEGRCLDPGRNAEIALTPDGLDLEQLFDVRLVAGTGTSLGAVIGQIPGLSQTVEQVLATLNTNLQDTLDRLGNPGLFASLGAVTSQCEAGPGRTASGDAELTDVDVFLRLPNQGPGSQRDVNLLDLKTSYPPNTKLVTQLSDVVDPILDELLSSLRQSGLPQEVRGALAGIKDQIRDQLLERVEGQLGPVEDNLLDVTLNKQTRAPGKIEVTAIDAAVLPAIKPQAGFNAAELRLARSQCGPGATLTDTPTTPTNPDSPDVPRVVPAGVGTPLDGVAARGNDATVPAALALLALMTFGSAVGFSTSRSRADA